LELDSPVQISLVVCTRNRAARLERTLQAFELMRCDAPWELIVVDNGSVDHTDQVLRDFQSRTELNVLLGREPRPGLCRARNKACSVARGEIVAFTDDDCYPATDFLLQISNCFREVDIGFMGGRVLLHDPTDLQLTLLRGGDRINFPPRSAIWPGQIIGANMAFRKKVLNRIGGFDERFGAGAPLRSAGDSDAVARASAEGYAGAYDPRPVVYHHHGRKTNAEQRALMAGYDLGNGGFFAKCLFAQSTRALYAKMIYWHLCGLVTKRKFGVLGRELRGGMRYLWSRR
jgi:glycosyltransferase involved in cell wall biosynthesis